MSELLSVTKSLRTAVDAGDLGRMSEGVLALEQLAQKIDWTAPDDMLNDNEQSCACSLEYKRWWLEFLSSQQKEHQRDRWNVLTSERSWAIAFQGTIEECKAWIDEREAIDNAGR